MARILDIPIPAVNDSFYDSSDSPSISQSLSDINNNLGAYIRTSSIMCLLPQSLISSIIFIESAGQNLPMNGAGAIGYMQLTAPFTYDTLRFVAQTYKQFGDLQGIINEYIQGIDYTFKNGTFPNWPSGVAEPQIQKALTYPQFNIVMGGMALRNCLNKTKNFLGNVRLDKAVIYYNWGMYHAFFQSPAWKKATISQVISSTFIPEESRNYVVKLMGKNGVLEININKPL